MFNKQHSLQTTDTETSWSPHIHIRHAGSTMAQQIPLFAGDMTQDSHKAGLTCQ